MVVVLFQLLHIPLLKQQQCIELLRKTKRQKNLFERKNVVSFLDYFQIYLELDPQIQNDEDFE